MSWQITEHLKEEDKVFVEDRSQLPNTNTPNRNFPVENKEAVMEHLNYYKTNPDAPGAAALFNKVRVVGATGDVVESSTRRKKRRIKS